VKVLVGLPFEEAAIHELIFQIDFIADRQKKSLSLFPERALAEERESFTGTGSEAFLTLIFD
jgi:hypothetical protein